MIRVHNAKFAGKTSTEKIASVREKMKEKGAGTIHTVHTNIVCVHLLLKNHIYVIHTNIHNSKVYINTFIHPIGPPLIKVYIHTYNIHLYITYIHTYKIQNTYIHIHKNIPKSIHMYTL